MPPQDGRTFVVTGGAGGLGLEVSRALAAIGAHVVLAVRSPEKGNAAAARIRATGVRGSVEVRRLDVSDLSSVRDFAEQLPGVDVLVNNAGVMAVPRATSVDGFELQFASGFRELVGWPAMVGRAPAASDPDLAKALWARSGSLSGVMFPC
jgi:NAD(P)-dependent dehydrogenase (short-subunit alcohol dehydrogenase family)